VPYRALGAIPDTLDTRDFILEATPHFFIGAIPPAVDMRAQCSPVRDQGHQGSCTGFAIGTGLREFLEKKTGKPAQFVEVAPAFIYYEERVLENSTTNCDAGAMIRDGLKVLAKQGVCPETDDPYSDKTCKGPSKKAVNDATKLKISAYQRITTLSGLKRALASGDGCVLGILVYASFESDNVIHTGHVPMPAPNEELLGGHALFCCGYKDDPQYDGGGYLIVKNSWGTGFGDKGYVYLPYAYVQPKLMSDIWTASV
jgi:C1A family cysteine protease